MNLETIGKITSQLGEVKGHINRMASRIGEVFGVEHDNETGVHTNITATSITVAAPVDNAGNMTGSLIPSVGNTYDLGGQGATTPFTYLDWRILRIGTAIYFGRKINASTLIVSPAWSFLPTSDNLVITALQATTQHFKLLDINSLTLLEAGGDNFVVTGPVAGPGVKFAQSVQHAGALSADVGLYERARTVLMGEWTAVSYAAGNFTASAGAWTVDSGDQLIYRYALVGKTMFLRWSIASTDVTVGGVLRLAIPGGFTANVGMDGFHRAIDAGGAAVAAMCRVTAGAAFVELYATANAGAFGVTAADNTTVVGGLDFEVA